MQFVTKIIPHLEQPYNTVADWRFSDDEKTCFINVSDLEDEDYHNALILHEMTEIMLLLGKFTPAEALKLIDAFDEKFERERTDNFESEPGDSEDAPYYLEHCFATAAERNYLAACGKNWQQYENKMVALMQTYPKK